MSDQPLKLHTRAKETEVTYALSIWLDQPNDEDAANQGQIFECILKEWSVQVEHMREKAASKAAKANKDDGGEDDKQTKPKSKRSSCKTAGKQKSSSSKKVKLPDVAFPYFP